MAEIEDDGPTPPSPPSNGAVALFLALYLLLLAFFILLNTISTFEEVKTREVQESLSSAFASILPPTTSLQTVTSIEGPTVSAQETQSKLGHLFETAIKVVRVEVIQPGKLMEVIMHVDQLFDNNSILIRERQSDFMRQLAEVLADEDGYASYEMEMVMGSQIEDKGTIQIENNLQIAQAGSFARELIDVGAPEDRFFVGIDPGADPFIVTFRFFWNFGPKEAPQPIDRNETQTPNATPTSTTPGAGLNGGGASGQAGAVAPQQFMIPPADGNSQPSISQPIPLGPQASGGGG
jgi:flagellar motor protein MotB